MLTLSRRLAITAIGLFATLTFVGLAPVPEVAGNWERLRGMPPELRSHLANQLREFSLLDHTEQEAVRTLDRKIAAEPEEDRGTDFAVLRRYHLWLQTLAEVQRAELAATPPSKRMALVTKFLADRKAADKTESSFYHYADFNDASPFDLAQRIEAWFKLTEAQQAELARLPEADRLKRMNQYAREFKINVARPPLTEMDTLYHRALGSNRFPYLKKAEETKKQVTLKHRFVDNYYFVEHPPAKVSPDKLLQFNHALPYWVRGSFDTFPPDEARRRLTILYRLIYPQGEMPDSIKVPASPAPSSRPPAPPKKAPTGSNPF